MSRELDALVAEKVFGISVARCMVIDHGETLYSGPVLESDGGPPAPYTSDAGVDFEVLKHVRENWPDEPQMRRFTTCLILLWEARRPESFIGDNFELYEPGDYSKAALKAIGETV